MCNGRCSINHGHGPKACKLAKREQGNEAGQNCDHAHDGMAVAGEAAPPLLLASVGCAHSTANL